VLFLSSLVFAVKLKLQYPAAAGALYGAFRECLLVNSNDVFAGGAGHFIKGLPAVPVAAAAVMVPMAAVSVAAPMLFLFRFVVMMAASLMALAVLVVMTVSVAALMLPILIVVMVAAALVLVIIHVEAIVVHIVVNYFLDGSQIVGNAVQLVTQITDSALEGVHILSNRAQNIYDSAYELFFLRLLAKSKTLGETLQISNLFSS